jgi:hypothetical protein
VSATANRIGVVLDQSGMVSFARGDVRVAELLVETAAHRMFVGLPAVALLAAHRAVQGDEVARARLGVLAALPAARVLPLTEAEAPGVAALPGAPEADLGRAHAAWVAETHRAFYATTDSSTAPTCLPRGQIVDLTAEEP